MNMAAQQCGICGWDAIGGPGCQVTSLAPKRIDNLRVTTADRGTLHSTVQPLLRYAGSWSLVRSSVGLGAGGHSLG